MKKLLKKFLFISPFIILGIGIMLFSQLNRIFKSTVENVGPKAFGAPVTLENVRISILSGKGTLSGLVVGNPEGFKTDSAFELGRLFVDINTSTIRSDVIHIHQVLIEAPTITFEGLKGRNIKTLQENIRSFAGKREAEVEEAGSDVEAEPPVRVVIDHLSLTGGTLNYAPLFGKSIPIPLPTIEMKNIGEASGGATMASVVAQLVTQIDDTALGAIAGAKGVLADALGKAAAKLGNDE